MEKERLFRFVARCFLTAAVLFFFTADPILAVDVTRVTDIRAATKFADSKGWCDSKNEIKGDCKKKKTFCNDTEWSAFIMDNVEFTPGGGALPKKGFGDVGLVARSALVGGAEIAARKLAGERLTDADLLPTEIYTYLRKDPRNRARIVPITEATCFCECGENDSAIACKGKSAGTPLHVRGNELFAREECSAVCAKSKRKIASLCAGSLPIITSLDISSEEGQRAAKAAELASNIDALCFTTEECTKQKGGWESWARCKDGKGRCFAREPIITLNTQIGGVKTIQGVSEYIMAVFRYAISIVAVVTTVMFIFGAFLYMIGSTMDNIKTGKKIMFDAIVGMLLIIGSVTILRTLNPQLLRLDPIRVFMINTVKFIEATYCSELEKSIKLADAGEPPSIKSYDEVSSKPGAFSVDSKKAVCGHKFFVEGSIGQPCEGDYCVKKSDLCIGCADASIKECQGVPGTRKVCATLKFAGTINYADGRFPEEVSLIMVCGFAQAKTADTTEKNIKDLYENNLAQVAQIVGTAKTVEDVSGQATYIFDLDETKLQNWANTKCTGDGNGFRGALLGLQYNDDVNIGERMLTKLTIGIGTADDMAIISKQNCGGGVNKFDGYATGQTWDVPDLARALQCGFGKGKLMNAQLDYWSLDELKKAARGEGPLTCNFNLSEANAKSNPGEIKGGQFCSDDHGPWRIDYDPKKGAPSAGAGRKCIHGERCTLEFSNEREKCTNADGLNCYCVDWSLIPNVKNLRLHCWVSPGAQSGNCFENMPCLNSCTDTCRHDVGNGYSMLCRCSSAHLMNCLSPTTRGC